jgi:hypothetical protein
LPGWYRQAPVHSDRPVPANVGKWGKLKSPPESGRSRIAVGDFARRLSKAGGDLMHGLDLLEALDRFYQMLM